MITKINICTTCGYIIRHYFPIEQSYKEIIELKKKISIIPNNCDTLLSCLMSRELNLNEY